LLRALNDEYPIVRHEAIHALAKIGGSESRAALESLLDGRSPYLRSIAAKALIELFGVPGGEQDNLQPLFKLLSSKDGRIEEAILQMGNRALAFLSSKLDDASQLNRQNAARAMALYIRRTLNQLPSEQEPFSWLAEHDLSVQAIANLYRFTVARRGSTVHQVSNSGFDVISRIISGNKNIRLSQKIPSIGDCDVNVTKIDLESFLAENCADRWERMGRTLIAPTEEGFLALKLCLDYGDREKLLFEARLQKYLRGIALSSTLPRPLGELFKIEGLPRNILGDINPKDSHAICYIASRDYLTYLNDPRISLEDLKRSFSSCAKDLARLSREGMILTSLIPLFHRKGLAAHDCIAYRWHRKVAGRMERWLESCRYPNLRLSGLADFEHIELHMEIPSDELQFRIGEHLLSMSLVLGSYFRHKGKFDQRAMKSIIRGSFLDYYCTLTAMPSRLDEVIDWDDLASRMIEEMEFGGCDDISGQHLGAAMGPFPIPELIRAIHVTSIFAVMQMQSSLPRT